MCLPLSLRSFSSIIFAAFVLCEKVVNQKIALSVFFEFSKDNFQAVMSKVTTTQVKQGSQSHTGVFNLLQV